MNYHNGRLVLSSLCVGVFVAAGIWWCSFCRLKHSFSLQNDASACKTNRSNDSVQIVRKMKIGTDWACNAKKQLQTFYRKKRLGDDVLGIFRRSRMITNMIHRRAERFDFFSLIKSFQDLVYWLGQVLSLCVYIFVASMHAEF